MSAKINPHQIEGATVLEVSDRIMLGEGAVTLRDAIQDALKTGIRKLVLDMGGVSYMDSSGVSELTEPIPPPETKLRSQAPPSYRENRRPDADHQARDHLRHLLERARSALLLQELTQYSPNRRSGLAMTNAQICFPSLLQCFEAEAVPRLGNPKTDSKTGD